MSKLLDKKDVRVQLAAKEETIGLRLQGLQHELETTGEAIQAAIFDHPLVSTAGALVAGVTTGLVFGGRRKKRRKADRQADRPDVPAAHRNLVDHYIDAVARRAQQAEAAGDDPQKAVRRALEGRVPVVAYAPASAQQDEGFFKQGFDLAIKTAFGFAVRSGLDFVTDQLGLTPPHTLAQHDDHDVEGGSAVFAAVSEEP
ncbi:MAG: hypothetical protein ACR2GR_03810 [Rhodothermales bacterium]